MKDIRTIKKLNSQITKLSADIAAIKIEIATKQRELSEKVRSVNILRDEIRKLEGNNKVKLSEHAIVRYLERVKGVDISSIEQEIITEELLSLVNSLGGTGTYPSKNGYSIIVKNNTVTTVTTPDM